MSGGHTLSGSLRRSNVVKLRSLWGGGGGRGFGVNF